MIGRLARLARLPATRRLVGEHMDAPNADPRDLRKSLAYLRHINRLLRYNRSTISRCEAMFRDWPKGRVIRVLDVACGSGDLLDKVSRWGASRGTPLDAVGLDWHAATAAEANRRADDRFAVVRGDARSLPFADGSFDLVTCSLFLHHQTTPDAVSTLREMARVTRHGLVAADLLRRRRAYAWVTLLSAFANPIVRHDAPASVAAAFSYDEAEALRREAGLSWCVTHETFAHRFAISGVKSA